jgi:hypothetical protein
MGAGDQGGGANAEDSAIRRQFSADPNATAKDARDYFRDRDSGKLATNAYFNSEAPGSGGQSNRDLLERQLGNQGLSLEGQNFVRYDEQGNRGTVGGINQKGNFWGSADLSGVNSPSYLGQNARGTGSRDRRYGSNANAMSQGTLDPKIQNSLIDLVTYNPTGTVTGMNSQQVYNPTSLFSGDPNRTYNMDTGLYETDESIGFDDSSPSILGRMASGAANYIGDGGMMGAVTRGLGGLSDRMRGDSGGLFADENIMNPTRPVLRPTDGSTTDNMSITDALMRGAGSVNKLTSDQLRNLPQYAGGYTGSGADNPFLSADQRGVLNQFDAQGQPGMTNYAERNSPVFNALGLPESAMKTQVGGGPLSDAFLFRSELPSDMEGEFFEQMMPPVGDTSPSLQDLAETEPVITAGFSGFNTNMGKPKPFSNTTNQFDPQQRIIDDALAPLGDRVSMYEDDPSIAFGFGGEPFDLSEGAESIVSPDQTYYDAFGNPYADAEQANTSDRIDNRAAEQALQDVTNMGSLREEYIPPLAGFGGIRSDENPMSSYSTTPSLPTFSPPPVINQIATTDNQFVSPESPIGPSAFPPRASEPTTNFPSAIETAINDARTTRLSKLNGFNPAGIGEPIASGQFNGSNMYENDEMSVLDPRFDVLTEEEGLNDNMYNDGSEIFDLSETYDPSGGGFTDGGGGGGSFTGCPEGYEPMTLETGETVCVPIEEEEEEEEDPTTPMTFTPTVRPTMGPSAYTPQAVSPIRPYTLQPGERGAGGLADILQLQNYPIIV